MLCLLFKIKGVFSGVKKVAQVLQVFQVDFMRLGGFFGLNLVTMTFHFLQSMIGEERRNDLIVTAKYAEDIEAPFLLNNPVRKFWQKTADGSHFEQRVRAQKGISQGGGSTLGKAPEAGSKRSFYIQIMLVCGIDDL